MRTVEYGRTSLGKGKATMRYYLTVDTYVCGAGCELESYGVLVSGEDGETAAVRCITPSAERIEELLAVLLRGRVTPVSLKDVIEDWVSGLCDILI